MDEESPAETPDITQILEVTRTPEPTPESAALDTSIIESTQTPVSTAEPMPKPHEYKPKFGPKSKLSDKGTRQIPIFYPTMNEMSDFSAYIEQIERKSAHLESGIAKV